MAHTPTPWKVEDNYVYGSDGKIIAVAPEYHPDAYDQGGIAHKRCADDGDLIVRAVNAYEANEALIKELVAALTDACDMLDIADRYGLEVDDVCKFGRGVLAKAEAR